MELVEEVNSAKVEAGLLWQVSGLFGDAARLVIWWTLCFVCDAVKQY